MDFLELAQKRQSCRSYAPMPVRRKSWKKWHRPLALLLGRQFPALEILYCNQPGKVWADRAGDAGRWSQ